MQSQIRRHRRNRAVETLEEDYRLSVQIIPEVRNSVLAFVENNRLSELG
jgi:hypothetical protein